MALNQTVRFFLMAALLTPATAAPTGTVVTIGEQVNGNSVPWRGSGTAMRFQCIWLQNEIGAAGYINSVEFAYQSGGSTAAFNNVRVFLSHTKKTGLEAIFDNNYDGNTPVKVLDKLSLSLTGTGWLDIGITPNTFDYNNQDNLLMEILWKGDSGHNIYCWRYDMVAGRVYAFSDTASSGTVYNEGQYIRIHINTMAGLEPTSLGRVRALYR